MDGKTFLYVFASIASGNNVEDVFVPMVTDASFKHCRELIAAVREDMRFIGDAVSNVSDSRGKFRVEDTPYFQDPGADRDYLLIDREPLITDIARVTAGLRKVVEILSSFQNDKTMRQLLGMTNTTFNLEVKSDVFDDFHMRTSYASTKGGVDEG